MNRLLADASRCDGIIRVGPAMAAGRGFTLIEVLLATVLLAAGLAIAFSTLTAATRTATRGEALAQRSERMRNVEGFLRKRLTAARPVGFGTDESSLMPQRFIGEPDRMRFVADLPDYLGRGGPYLHDIRIEDDGEGVRIDLVLAMVLAGETIEDPDARPPEPLVDGLASARFRYRAADPEGGLGEWQDRWETSHYLPLLVEVTLTGEDGRKWPPLVVALPLASGGDNDPFAGGF